MVVRMLQAAGGELMEGRLEAGREAAECIKEARARERSKPQLSHTVLKRQVTSHKGYVTG